MKPVLDKIKQYYQKAFAYLGDLRDTRTVGRLVFVAIVLLISWSGIKVIDTNYGLQKQITALGQQNQLQALKNTNLELQNQYLGTNQYLDITAREEFGLASPGEKELIVPRSVALAHTVDLPSLGQQTKGPAANRQPGYQHNFQAWMDFLLHRQPS